MKGYRHPSVHCSTVYSNQDMEATYMSIDRRVDKEDVIHTHTHTKPYEYCLAMRKKEILPFVTTRMKLEDIMLNEIRQKKTNTV